MEIWIRSQDKKHLMKAETIMYEETGTRYGLRVFSKNYDFNIATYKTKERALEVLDEIHERIINLQLVNLEEKGQARKDVYVKPYLKCVYKMPKE